jgi:predicted phosphodiesterase
MRVLLISDIHANLIALERVLQLAPKHDVVWCLGDVVGYGPAPNECIERLRALDPVCLAGNHDWAVLDKLPLGEFNPDARQAVLWTRSILTAENRAWLEELAARPVAHEKMITLVHGSPRHPIWEYIFSTTIAAENLDYFDTPICFFGHTHVPALYHRPRRARTVTGYHLPEKQRLKLALSDKTLLNPGSVGQPRDGDSRAAYAVLETDTQTITHYRGEYDRAATQAAMIRARLPPRLIERLSYGV